MPSLTHCSVEKSTQGNRWSFRSGITSRRAKHLSTPRSSIFALNTSTMSTNEVAAAFAEAVQTIKKP
jgi:hypothetical protein